MFKTSLQLKTSQNFQLTPQLQQSLKFLQVSSLELEETLNHLLLENPFLTTEEFDQESATDLSSANEVLSSAAEFEEMQEFTLPEEHLADSSTLYDLLKEPVMQNEMPIDNEWEDYYPDDSITYENNSSFEHEFNHLETQGTKLSLQSHLEEQASLTPFTPHERLIATYIIDALDQNGYLLLSKTELIQALQAEDPHFNFEEAYNSVLMRIQRFEPIGLATYSLKERLSVQLQTHPPSQTQKNALLLLNHYNEELEKRQFALLSKKAGLEELEIKKALSYLSTLNPFPAESFALQQQTPIAPDIIVKKTQQQIEISINNSIIPKIKLDNHYVKMLKSTKMNHQNNNGNKVDLSNFLLSAYQEAKNVLYSIEHRHKTLLLIAHQIVAYQTDFFSFDKGNLRPMTLKDIADSIEMSESTVSRACQNKSLICNKGMFDLRFFFSSSVNNSEGVAISSEQIKSLIKQWIDEENKTKPLSDSKLEKMLEKEGFEVARRTITKYREQLGYNASHLRKVFT